MAKEKQSEQRPFDRAAVDSHAVSALRLRMGPGEAAWRYTITVPLREMKPNNRQKATAEDLDNLHQMFSEHFSSFSRLPNGFGVVPRDLTDPDQGPTTNFNAHFAVLSSPIPEADAYFRALRAELESALD